jgi:hypothetical protein
MTPELYGYTPTVFAVGGALIALTWALAQREPGDTWRHALAFVLIGAVAGLVLHGLLYEPWLGIDPNFGQHM